MLINHSDVQQWAYIVSECCSVVFENVVVTVAARMWMVFHLDQAFLRETNSVQPGAYYMLHIAKHCSVKTTLKSKILVRIPISLRKEKDAP